MRRFSGLSGSCLGRVAKLLAVLPLIGLGVFFPAPTVGAANCNPYLYTIPANQRLAGAQAAMTQERTVSFNFASSVRPGTLVFDVFIAQAEVTPAAQIQAFLGNWYWPVLPAGWRVKLLGNDRGHSRTFNPGRTKATIALDADRGWGYLAANSTTWRFQIVTPIYTQTVYNHTFTARQPVFGWKHSGRQWIRVDWTNQDVLRTRYQLTVAGPMPANAPGVPSIQHQHFLNVQEGGYIWQGNLFPSRAVYRYQDCAYIERIGAYSATDHNQLYNVPTFLIDYAVSGVTPRK